MYPRIEGWFVIGGCVVGNVYGHTEFTDGDEIRTSRIERDWMKDDIHYVQTESGSVYILGEHDR